MITMTDLSCGAGGPSSGALALPDIPLGHRRSAPPRTCLVWGGAACRNRAVLAEVRRAADGIPAVQARLSTRVYRRRHHRADRQPAHRLPHLTHWLDEYGVCLGVSGRCRLSLAGRWGDR